MVTAAESPKIVLYNNLNRFGLSRAINGVNQVSPPDSTGAIGPSNYVEMVNAGIGIWRRDLVAITHTGLQTFVGAPANTPYCDPQIQWDPTAGRWFYAFLFCDTTASVQDFHFGWSKTADPSNVANGWCHFSIQTSQYLFDFPKLGHNSKYLIFGGNLYDTGLSSTNPPFAGAQLVWVPKPASGVTTCTTPPIRGVSAFPLLNGDGTTAFTPVPVNTITGAGDGYVVSAHDPSSAPQTNLAVWHVDSSGNLHQNSDIPVASFSMPAPAPEAGSSNLIDTLDGRLTQAVGDPTTGIWTQHTVDGPGGRSVVEWYEIKVAAGNATLAQQGDIASSTDFVFNGAISPRADSGGAAVVYNRSSATIDPIIATRIRVSATAPGAMEPGEIVLDTTVNTFDNDFTCNDPSPGIPCRWGDYSGATPDPIVKSVVWGTSEEVFDSTPPNPAWIDRNFAIQVLAEPHAPTAVLVAAGESAATVAWTPSTFDAGGPVISYTITAYVGATAGSQLVVAAPAMSATFEGLTDGVTYTFTVFATNSVESSPESVHSASVTPPRQAAQSSPVPPAGRPPANPGPPMPSGTPTPPGSR